jgi:hypothetical protein
LRSASALSYRGGVASALSRLMSTLLVTGLWVVDFDHGVRPHTVASVAGSGIPVVAICQSAPKLLAVSTGVLYLYRQEESLDVRSTY